MSHTKCRTIGTSQGIIIPSHILSNANIHLNDILDITFSKSENIIVIKKTEPEVVRKNWGKSFKEMHKNCDDSLLIADIFHDEDFDETI